MTDPLINGFDVTVRGQAYVAHGKDRTISTFGPITFFLPEKVEIANGKKKIEKTVGKRKTVTWEPQTKHVSTLVENVALYVVTRRLLPEYFRTNMPEASGVRTCSIVPGGIKAARKPQSMALSTDKPVAEMTLPELKVYAKLRDLTLDLSNFTDPKSAREAIQYAIEEKKRAAEEASKAPEAPPEPIDPNAPSFAHVVPSVQTDEDDLLG